MTTKELIQQYVTAHADNRWMDASELEALLTEFAEKLKEPASEDLERCVVEQMEADGDVDDFVRRGIDDIASKYAQLGAQWQREQIMKDAIDARIIAIGQNAVVKEETEDDFRKCVSKFQDGDKVKVIIIKE